MAISKDNLHGVIDQNGHGYSSPKGNQKFTKLDSAGRIIGSKAGIVVNPRDLGVIVKSNAVTTPTETVQNKPSNQPAKLNPGDNVVTVDPITPTEE